MNYTYCSLQGLIKFSLKDSVNQMKQSQTSRNFSKIHSGLEEVSGD